MDGDNSLCTCKCTESMRTRSGSDYFQHRDLPLTPTSNAAMEMDALDTVIASLDAAGPLTTDSVAKLLRGLAKTVSNNCEDMLKKKDTEIRELETRVGELEERCDEMEQYYRRNIVRFRGIAERRDENTDGLVLDMVTKKMEVPLAVSDLVRSHRVGRKAEDRDAPRDIIVSFTTHNAKQRIMQSGRKLKGTHIYVNEDLTKTRGTIAWEARKLKREGKVVDTWTRDGTVFVKVGENNIKPFRSVKAWKAFCINR